MERYFLRSDKDNFWFVLISDKVESYMYKLISAMANRSTTVSYQEQWNRLQSGRTCIRITLRQQLKSIKHLISQNYGNKKIHQHSKRIQNKIR